MRNDFPGNILDAPKEVQYGKAKIWRNFLNDLKRGAKVAVNGTIYAGEDLLWGKEVQEDFDWAIMHQDDCYEARCDREGFVGDPNWDS